MTTFRYLGKAPFETKERKQIRSHPVGSFLPGFDLVKRNQKGAPDWRLACLGRQTREDHTITRCVTLPSRFFENPVLLSTHNLYWQYDDYAHGDERVRNKMVRYWVAHNNLWYQVRSVSGIDVQYICRRAVISKTCRALYKLAHAEIMQKFMKFSPCTVVVGSYFWCTDRIPCWVLCVKIPKSLSQCLPFQHARAIVQVFWRIGQQVDLEANNSKRKGVSCPVLLLQ